ncbi:hypothetical protein S83_049524 [Arachis hypogaea]|nr:ubiquitin carboxyl-terminal hydrolase 20-like isoform X2 [Arachis hypogaea]XP_025697831.1 ubiquitin carboxyl-terminal hydrolase 20-like isoform X2 [Arachis hypogaea]
MCVLLPAPAEPRRDEMDALLEPPSTLSRTLDSAQLVPPFPNPNDSFSVETLASDNARPSAEAATPATGDDIYSAIIGKEDPLEDLDPSSSFRIFDDDLSSSFTAAPAPLSSSKDSDSWLFSGDAGDEPSMNEDSGSAVVPSRVGAGLWNLGNTCFLNAIVQCFTHTVPLVQGLRSCIHSAPCDGDGDRFCVICALREQIESSLGASGGVLSPSKLVDNLNHFSSMFRRYQQEDAHEFMQCVLDKLEMCFKDLKKNSTSFEDDNLVEKVFGGRSLSKLRCCNCGHSSDTYEPLIDLSLEIDNVDTLSSALESFTKVENIDAKFKCDSCKEEVSMEKQIMLDQTPSIATFHLKRFKTDGTYVEKIDKHVNFPLELDLQPYTISHQNNNVPLKYELYAVVVHIGFSSTSGHYFSFVRSAPDTWHKLDDSKVTMVSEESVLSEEAYILFYARQGTPWLSSIMELMPCTGPNTLNTSPKSVLDIIDNKYTANPVITANTEGSKVSEPGKFLEQQFHYSCQKRHELHEINDVGDTSHDCKQSPPRPNCVGFSGSNVSLNTQMPLPNNAIPNIGGSSFNGNSPTDGSPDKNKHSGEAVDIAVNDSFHPLTPPSSPLYTPDQSYYIPRDHLKSENRIRCKRSLNTLVLDSERQEALKCVKKMSGSRKEALLQFVSPISEPSNKRKRKIDSSLCKKRSPHSASSKSNHLRPVAAGISRILVILLLWQKLQLWTSVIFAGFGTPPSWTSNSSCSLHSLLFNIRQILK